MCCMDYQLNDFGFSSGFGIIIKIHVVYSDGPGISEGGGCREFLGFRDCFDALDLNPLSLLIVTDLKIKNN